MERSLFWYIGNPRILTNTYTTARTTKQVESIVSSLFNRSYSIIANKDDLTKENAKIKQVLKENRYQESISVTTTNTSRRYQNDQNGYKFTVR